MDERRRARRAAHPPARADRAGRGGPLPRLGRRRLDVPLPRAARARLSGLGPPRRPRPARRRVRRGRALLRARARRRGRAAPARRQDRGRAPRRSATRSAPGACARRAIRSSDQVETILYRLVASGNTRGDQGAARGRRRAAAALPLARGDRGVLPGARARVPRRLVEPRHGARPAPATRCCRCSSASTRRRAENILRVLDERRTLPPALAELLDVAGRLEARRPGRRPAGGAGARPALARARARRAASARSTGGPGASSPPLPGLRVRGWRPGDRLAGRSKKIQDVFVDAKIPRSDREGWPLVVRGDEVVAVPGIVEAEGVSATRVAD